MRLKQPEENNDCQIHEYTGQYADDPWGDHLKRFDLWADQPSKSPGIIGTERPIQQQVSDVSPWFQW